MPFFSVIIPTYNRAPVLRRLLDLFTKQAFGDFEVIVVDDGGNDHSEEVVAGFSDKRFHYFKKTNGGVSSARNFGITKTTGRYVNFFDSDDLVYPNHLSEAHRFFISNPVAEVVIFDYEWGQEPGKKSKLISNKYKDLNRAIWYKNYISTNCIFIERHLTDKLRFDEQLSISEDWQYWIRLAAITRFFAVNISTSYIVEHPERSINKIGLSSIIMQKDHFISSLRNDKSVMAVKGFNLNSIVSHFYSLIALNGALIGEKKITQRYFIQSVLFYFPSLLSRRSSAIIKYLLFKW